MHHADRPRTSFSRIICGGLASASLVVLFTPLWATGATGRPSVTRICSEIVSRQPVKCLTHQTAFIPGNRLYANSQFTHFNAHSELSHVWYFEGREIFRAKLTPAQSGWRAQTNVSTEGRSGNWRFVVETKDHAQLESLSFTVATGKKGIRARLLGAKSRAEANSAHVSAQPLPAIEPDTFIDFGAISPEAESKPPQRLSAPPTSSDIRNPLAPWVPLVVEKPVPEKPIVTPAPAPSPVQMQVETIPSPAPAALKTEDLGAMTSGSFYLGLGLASLFDRLDTTQKTNSQTATFLSNPLLGTDFFAKYLWPGHSMLTTARFTWATNSYESIPGRTLAGIPSGLWGASLSQQFLNLLPGLHAQVSIGLTQDFFELATSNSNLEFSSVTLPSLSAGLTYVLWGGGRSELTLQANGVHEFGASTPNYEVTGAWGVLAATGWRGALDPEGSNSVAATLSFERLWQDASFVQRTTTEPGFELSFTRRLGP
jgi:hypothetical protein